MMPSAADLALVQGAIASMFDRTLTVWRVPAPAGGAPTNGLALAASVQGAIAPVDPLQRLQLAAQGLGGARYDAVGYVANDSPVRAGDELRDGVRRYKVEGTAPWAVVTTLALSRMPDLPVASHLTTNSGALLTTNSGNRLTLH